MDRCAIGFVIAGFEDVRDAEVRGDSLDGISHHARMLLGFDDAGTRDQKELSTAHRDVADIEGMAGCVAHKRYLTTAKKGGKVFGAIFPKVASTTINKVAYAT